jgi:hypothetical protein
MNIVQAALLPQLTQLNLHQVRPTLTAPVHFVCGDDDPFVSGRLAGLRFFMR